jgi:hypothetical protein
MNILSILITLVATLFVGSASAIMGIDDVAVATFPIWAKWLIGAGITTAAGVGSYFGSGGGKSSKTGKGGSEGMGKVNLYTPEQREKFKEMSNMGLSGVRGLLDRPYEQLPEPSPQLDFSKLVSPYRFDFEPVANEARANFFNKTVPTIAERFAGLGSRPSTNTGLIGQLGAAGSGLERSLGALRSKYGLLQQNNLADQALRQAGLQLGQQGQQWNQQAAQPYFQQQQQAQKLGGYQNLLGGGLGQQFQPTYQPPSPSLLQSAAPGIGQGIGQMGTYAAMRAMDSLFS